MLNLLDVRFPSHLNRLVELGPSSDWWRCVDSSIGIKGIAWIPDSSRALNIAIDVIIIWRSRV